jgi:hypothetical protein
MTADAATARAKEKAAGADSDDLHPIMGPFVDSYRTLLAAPPQQMVVVLQQMGDFPSAA